MKIAVACDHRGYEAKRKLIPLLVKMGHEVVDYGCDGVGAVDYPDFAAPAARAVAVGTVEAAVLLDGSGIGMSITANKIPGVRAALAHDELTARRAREHHHCNVLCLGTDLLTDDHVRAIVEVFLATEFATGRHARRIEKLRQIELEAAAVNGQPAAAVVPTVDGHRPGAAAAAPWNGGVPGAK